ncbi:MAG: class I SAM-dependent methyltransferase, partial [Pseudomonadota bacterium]
ADPREGGPDGAEIEFRTADARDLSDFDTDAFDIAHSNSVIEHVGGYADMKRFANEVRRVGKAYYVQTPYYWFPVDPHYGAPFVHWLPVSLRLKLITAVGVGFKERFETVEAGMSYIEFVNLIDKKIGASLFPDASVEWERLLFWPKSLLLIGPKDRTDAT